MHRLELHGNKIYDEGAIELVQSPALSTVQYLDLGDNDITDVSGQALAESPYAGALRWIELGGALLESSTRRALVKRFGRRIHFEYPWNRR